MDVLLQTEMLPCGGSDTPESFWLPTSSSSLLQGSKSMVDYENGDASFPQSPDKEESIGEDCCDDSCNRLVKKRRLSGNQVESLERNFAVENRLEPERKFKLAKELGMHPRQVAIWFQNRRARFKNKQLGKDYDLLKASYDKLKVDSDSLFKENEILRTEVLALKQKLPAKEKANGRLELDLFDVVNSSNADFDFLNASNEFTLKVEEATSVKSDVLDSESTNGTESSYVLEPDQAGFCKDEMDNLNKRLLQPPLFPSSQLECFYDHPLASFSSLGFTVEDQTLWSSLR